MKRLLSFLLPLLLLSLLSAPMIRADKTTRGKLQPRKGMMFKGGDREAEAVFDTIFSPADSLVRVSGYDKPLNSRKESLFVTNRLDRELTGVTLLLTYSDLSGRMLHEATRTINVIIPAGATRRLLFPSWDSQQTFYYRHGRRPRTQGVTPYDVSCKVISVTANP